MIAQYILGGLVILLSLFLICFGMYVISKGEADGFIVVLIGIIFVFPGVLIITSERVPTKQDVLDGKAIYQETLVITGNDTIKTYDIVWK